MHNIINSFARDDQIEYKADNSFNKITLPPFSSFDFKSKQLALRGKRWSKNIENELLTLFEAYRDLYNKNRK